MRWQFRHVSSILQECDAGAIQQIARKNAAKTAGPRKTGAGSCAVTTATVSYAVPPSEPSKRPTMVKIGPFLFYQVSSPTCTVSHRYLEKKTTRNIEDINVTMKLNTIILSVFY